MLDRAKHETVLKNILRDVYQHPSLGAQLAFKDGTCLFLFHALPRFSTDLDFTLVIEDEGDAFDPHPMRKIGKGLVPASLVIHPDLSMANRLLTLLWHMFASCCSCSFI